MYLDKRDKKGQLLSFEAFSLSEEIAEIGVKEFTKSSIYNELINIFPEKLTVLLFKKLIFEKVFATSSRMVISNFNKKKIINTDFYSINLLKKKNFSNFLFVKKKENFLSLVNLKNKIRDYFWLNYKKICFIRNIINFFFPFYKNKNKNKNIKIAVNFLDGLNLEERSDFFWYDKDILSNKVLTYFEDDSRITNKFYKRSKKKLNQN